MYLNVYQCDNVVLFRTIWSIYQTLCIEEKPLLTCGPFYHYSAISTRAQHINELLPAMRMRLARDISIKVANTQHTLLCSVRLDIHCLERIGAVHSLHILYKRIAEHIPVATKRHTHTRFVII